MGQYSWSCTPHTDVMDKNNQTPLHLACRGGSLEVVRYLVEDVKCDVGELIISVVCIGLFKTIHAWVPPQHFQAHYYNSD